MIKIEDIRVGDYVEFNGVIRKVVEIEKNIVDLGNYHTSLENTRLHLLPINESNLLAIGFKQNPDRRYSYLKEDDYSTIDIRVLHQLNNISSVCIFKIFGRTKLSEFKLYDLKFIRDIQWILYPYGITL